MRPDHESLFADAVHDDRAEARHLPILIDMWVRSRIRDEIEPESSENACGGSHAERAVIYDASPPFDTEDGEAVSTRAIHAAYQRLHVQRELWSKFRRVGSRELRREIDLFEAAIAQLEPREALAGPFLPPLKCAVDLDARPQSGSIDIDPSDDQPDIRPRKRSGSIDIDPSDDQPDIRPRKQRRTNLWAGMLVMAAMLVTGFYAKDTLLPAIDPLWQGARLITSLLLEPRGTPDERNKSELAPSLAQSAYRPGSTRRSGLSLPLPDSYGIYVVSDDRLTRLEPLRMRVPDTRIALPGVITKPSPVAVANGPLSFIAYQRDLMTNAPDNASIRIIAKVARALSFAATGKPTITNIEDSWAIRAVSIDLTVAPIPGNQEMVWIRPADPNVSLSPGRYMLAFKNQAYDFAVDGPITDTAHCLERTDTQNGAVYSECREVPDTVNAHTTWRHSALPQAPSTNW